MSEAPLTRLDAATAVLAAKAAKGLSWEDLAEVLGRSVVWSTSALLGQQPLDAAQAAAVGTALDLDAATVVALRLRPDRTSAAVDTTDPVVYRLKEALQVYGAAIAELIGEEFGDGIMSAIDFELDMVRRPDPKGDRVVLTFNGKFLPYRVW